MKYQLLNGLWQLHQLGNDEWMPAKVPGTVYGTYLENGKMDNPFWKDNEKNAMDMLKEDYEYSYCFEAASEIYNCRRIELLMKGVDTVGEIFLNEVKIGDTCNMHREWRYEVTDLLKEGENEIRVILHSPIQYIRKAYNECQSDGSEEAMTGFAHIRKAHCMFGWDWGPHLPDAGIWRDVMLVGEEQARLENVNIRQIHEAGKVGIRLEIEAEQYTLAPLAYTAELTAPDGTVQRWREVGDILWVDSPELWWPNGYGEQPLYVVRVLQYAKGMISDTFEKRIGLRTLTMHIERDEWGKCFAHQINGSDCFAMGADYIPEDNLLGRVTKETTYQLLKQCKESNFNTIRVWGGGYYPNDWFFDICDELGLMVWQDFMFACAVYELTDEFEENIKAEITENIKRIRNHACLGLWCGNNEMEMFVKDGLWVTRESQRADYIKMYEYIIPKLLKKYDPDTFYWPASPSSGGSFEKERNEDLLKAGKIAAYVSHTKPGYVIGEKEIYVWPIIDAYATTSTVCSYNWSIAGNAENPEKVMQFLNYAYGSKEFNNLIIWGEEGIDYQVVDTQKGIINFADGITAENAKYHDDIDWEMPNETIGYIWEGRDVDIWNKLKEFNDSAVKSKAYGFVFDPSGVTNEITALQNVNSKYYNALQTGSVDIEENIKLFIAEMKAAGIEKVVAEKQKQLNEWLAGKENN